MNAKKSLHIECHSPSMPLQYGAPGFEGVLLSYMPPAHELGGAHEYCKIVTASPKTPAAAFAPGYAISASLHVLFLLLVRAPMVHLSYGHSLPNTVTEPIHCIGCNRFTRDARHVHDVVRAWSRLVHNSSTRPRRVTESSPL